MLVLPDLKLLSRFGGVFEANKPVTRFDDSLRKVQKPVQRGSADIPVHHGRSTSQFSDLSISDPQTDTISVNRSDSRSDRRMLSHGDNMNRQSPGSNPEPLYDENINTGTPPRKLSRGDIMKSRGAQY